MQSRTITSPSDRPQVLSTCAGATLLELVVTLLISTLLLSGLFTMFDSVQRLYEDVNDRSSALQGARLALVWIQRDLALAGVGLQPLSPVFPTTIPRDDGGIDLRYNLGGLTSFLTADMPSPSQVEVNSVVGFAPGQRIAVYDAFGSIELADILSIDEPGNRITLDHNLSKTYKQADGAAVVHVEEISYWVEDLSGIPTLMRKAGTDPARPIAQHVVSLSVTYYEDSEPPAAFDPETPEDQARIRAIEVELTVWPEGLAYAGGNRPIMLRTRVTPRSLLIM